MTKTNNAPLSEIFNLPSIVEEIKQVPVTEEADLKDMSIDFDMARSNLISVLQTAEDAATNISDVAKQSQNARAYEVLNQLLNTRIVAAKGLLDLYKQRTEISGKKPSKETNITNNTQNNNYIGSPARLLQAIKDEKEKQARSAPKDITPNV